MKQRRNQFDKAARDDDNKSNEDYNEDEEYEDHDISYNDSEVYYSDFFRKTADKLNNTKKADMQDLVIFNRVAKVGSQSLMQLMIWLGKINHFEFSRDRAKSKETILLAPQQQKELISEIYQKPRPHIYTQHLAYINFTQHQLSKPIYINLVRDPVERIISWYYYIRTERYYQDMKLNTDVKDLQRLPAEIMNMDFDTCLQNPNIYCTFEQMQLKNPSGDHRRQTLFFCGQNRQLCMPFNSPAAMQKAKRTVEEEYAVVGTWENTNITLSVFEHYVPRFFKNAKAVYYTMKDHLSTMNKNYSKRPVSEWSKQILRKNLTYEIEFYEFCRQRLFLQYAAIRGDDPDNDNYTTGTEDEK